MIGSDVSEDLCNKSDTYNKRWPWIMPRSTAQGDIEVGQWRPLQRKVDMRYVNEDLCHTRCQWGKSLKTYAALTGAPSSPGEPGRPGGPGMPTSPVMPGIPFSPRAPWGPAPPLGPGAPWSPCKQTMFCFIPDKKQQQQQQQQMRRK